MSIWVKNKLIILLIFFIYFPFHSNATKALITNNANQIIHGPFKINHYNDGKIFFERNENKTITFYLEFKDKFNSIKKKLVDTYPIEGGHPQIESVFFFPVEKKNHIFVIVSWDVNSYGIGTYGKYFKIYAYKPSNNKQNVLIINTKIDSDPHLSGLNGMGDGQEIFFDYQTAAKIKKYIEKNYNQN